MEEGEVIVGLYIHSMENDSCFVDKMGFVIGE